MMKILITKKMYEYLKLSSTNNEHDEIDFEFLGNRTGQPPILQTNVFTGGKGNREQRIYLWFDPSKAYHTYSVLWNLYQIVYELLCYPLYLHYTFFRIYIIWLKLSGLTWS